MKFSAHKISYESTGFFSKLVLDYLQGNDDLKDFYEYSCDIEGIQKAINDRASFKINRQLLHTKIREQYSDVDCSDTLKANIEALLSEHTFTICTAHQPNIFTGHLYFIYKILQAVKLSNHLNTFIPEKKFVPVYYMGSEDADLDELGEVHVNGSHYKWHTKQTGAVGRMKIDKDFLRIIDAITGELGVEKEGQHLMQQVKHAYSEGKTLEAATFELVHHLFNEFGLIILMPDDKDFKSEFSGIIKRELEDQFSEKEVAKTVASFPKAYKVQAGGRAINLFYLADGIRERIEKNSSGFSVAKTKIIFSEAEMNDELNNHPERFSPNVILRPVFQEMILPNVAFIGGGGELAYWLELKNVFEKANAFFPVLILRNSFTIINKKALSYMHKSGLSLDDIFKAEAHLIEERVKRESVIKLELSSEKDQLRNLYDDVKHVSAEVDKSLLSHVDALRAKALDKLTALEKKIMRAQKKKFDAEQRQIIKTKALLFPNNTLQERVHNILEYAAAHGPAFIKMLYDNSESIQPNYTVLTEE